jgi:hypothetical protein
MPLLRFLRPALAAFAFAIALASPAAAHDGLDLAPPNSDPDAWNILQLCTANIEQLIGGEQWKEIPIQMALIGQSARYFKERTEGPLAENWALLEQTGIVLIRAALQKNGPEVRSLFTRYRHTLGEIDAAVDPKLRASMVYSCPMCRGIRELDPKVECFKCGMDLVPRVIPASSVYNIPGEPSIAMVPSIEAPLQPNRPSAVRVQLTRRKDGAPVLPEDLLVVHEERIHLLIVDESLADYHHEHPVPSSEPGVYEFSFTPRREGPYRIFADIVPRGSNMQEFIIADLPAAAAKGDAVVKLGSPTSSTAAGLRFSIVWHTGGLPMRARQPINAAIIVADSNGQPFTQLEPVMGAYSHLVAFHEGRKTVLHVHPIGAEPQKPEDRGGPRFAFRFWAPEPGFYKLYVQVQVGGKQVFAPFALHVEG